YVAAAVTGRDVILYRLLRPASKVKDRITNYSSNNSCLAANVGRKSPSAGWRHRPEYPDRLESPLVSPSEGKPRWRKPDGRGDQRGCSRSAPPAGGAAARGGAGTAGRRHHP